MTHSWRLMVVIPILGTFLIPFPFVVGATNLLPYIGVPHIDEAEEKTTEMGEVGDSATGSSLERGEEFDEPINDDHIFCRDGEEEVDIDEAVGEEPSIGEKDSIDRSGCADHRDALIVMGREEDRADPCTDPAEKEKSQKLFRSPVTFQFSSEHPESQKIEDNMGQSSVKEDVGGKLPYKIFFPDQIGDEPEVEDDQVADHHLEKEDGPHDDHQFLNSRC